jgi:hypothetical protein
MVSGTSRASVQGLSLSFPESSRDAGEGGERGSWTLGLSAGEQALDIHVENPRRGRITSCNRSHATRTPSRIRTSCITFPSLLAMPSLLVLHDLEWKRQKRQQVSVKTAAKRGVLPTNGRSRLGTAPPPTFDSQTLRDLLWSGVL